MTTDRHANARRAVAQLILLLALVGAAFFQELLWIARFAVRDSEAAHALALPVVLGILVARRRRRLQEVLGRGSLAGAALILLAVFVLLAASWPFNYQLPRNLAVVPALAGCVLAVGGWRWLWHTLPLLLLVLVAIPIGPRYYEFLILRPELLTLQAVRGGLELLPGVSVVTLQGPDLHYIATGGRGAIALGEPHRGATLLAACATVGLLVIFARIRPWWQLGILALLAGPLVLLCNALRLLTWGAVTIYADAPPTSGLPRAAAAVAALLLAWGLFSLFAAGLGVLGGGPPRDATGPSPELAHG